MIRPDRCPKKRIHLVSLFGQRGYAFSCDVAAVRRWRGRWQDGEKLGQFGDFTGDFPSVLTGGPHMGGQGYICQDAMIDVSGWFEAEAGTALGEAEMSSIVSGNGADKPIGLLKVPPESDSDGGRTADAFRYLASGTAAILGTAPGDHLPIWFQSLSPRPTRPILLSKYLKL